MGGPQWDYVSVNGGAEIRCLFADVIWSGDSVFVAFVEWHVEDVPNRQGMEGMTSRVSVHRLSDGQRRSFLGNVGLALVQLLDFSEGTLSRERGETGNSDCEGELVANISAAPETSLQERYGWLRPDADIRRRRRSAQRA